MMKKIFVILLVALLLATISASAGDVLSFQLAMQYRMSTSRKGFEPEMINVHFMSADDKAIKYYVFGSVVFVNPETHQIDMLIIPDNMEESKAIAAIAAMENDMLLLDDINTIMGKAPFDQAKMIYDILMNSKQVKDGDPPAHISEKNAYWPALNDSSTKNSIFVMPLGN